jgi:hypothetical protein
METWMLKRPVVSVDSVLSTNVRRKSAVEPPSDFGDPLVRGDAPPVAPADEFAAVFIFDHDLTELILRVLDCKGLDALLTIELDTSQALAAAQSVVRGICGERPPDKPPVRVIFAHDLLPIPLGPAQIVARPECGNARILAVRSAISVEANATHNLPDRHSPACVTDNNEQAWRAVQLLAPAHEASLRGEMARRAAAFSTPPALKNFSRHGCRAKVELVDYEGELAVRKTYRPGSERHMERELEVLEELGPNCSAIPRLIARGPNYFLTEYVPAEDQWRPKALPFALPFTRVRQLSQFVRTCVAHGFDPIDLRPTNNVLFTTSGLKVIDYEYWRRCEPSLPPENSYALAGLPRDYAGDRAMGVRFAFAPYRNKWFSYTGLSLQSFLYDPPWLQWLKRTLRLSVRLPALLLRSAARKAARRWLR